MHQTSFLRVFFGSLFFVLFSVESHAQKQLDSLRALVPALEGEEQIDLQITIARQLLYHSHTQAEELIHEVIRACDSLDYRSGMSLALVVRSTLYQFQSKFVEAKKGYLEAIALAEEIVNQEALAYGQLGLGGLHINKGELALAYENHITGIASARTLDKPDLELTYLMNIGVIKQLLTEYEEAETYLQQALVIAEEHELVHRYGQVYGNLGIVELKRKNYGNSIEYQQQALVYFDDLKAYTQAAICLQNIGFAYAKLREYGKAAKAYDQSIELRLQSGDSLGYGKVLRYKGELNLDMGNTNMALRLLEEALTLAKRFDNEVLVSEILELQFSSYEKQADFRKALEVHKELTVAKDTLAQRANQTKVAELTSTFELEKLENENRIQLQKNEIKDLRIQQKNQLLTAFAVLIAVVALWGLYRRRQLKNQLVISDKDRLIAQKEVELRVKEFESEKSKLTLYAHQLLSKNRHLEEVKQKLENELSHPVDQQQEIDQLIEKLRSTINDEKDWTAFRLYFDSLFPDFFDRAHERLGNDLTMYEQRLVALIKIALSNKEIGGILNISRTSVVRAKHRLRTKFGFEDNKSFESFIAEL